MNRGKIEKYFKVYLKYIWKIFFFFCKSLFLKRIPRRYYSTLVHYVFIHTLHNFRVCARRENCLPYFWILENPVYIIIIIIQRYPLLPKEMIRLSYYEEFLMISWPWEFWNFFLWSFLSSTNPEIVKSVSSVSSSLASDTFRTKERRAK